jgi:hypothetical protein
MRSAVRALKLRNVCFGDGAPVAAHLSQPQFCRVTRAPPAPTQAAAPLRYQRCAQRACRVFGAGLKSEKGSMKPQPQEITRQVV